MEIVDKLVGLFKNAYMNGAGVDRDLYQLIADKDISRAQQLFQDRDIDVSEAIKEYNPETHEIMHRPDKRRKNKQDYKTQKLPRSWQQYINEVALFFLLSKPVEWTLLNSEDESLSEAFDEFKQFMEDIRFNTYMRKSKRLAGSETECAKLYRIYRDDETNEPKVNIIQLAKSLGHTIRPLFDQYGNLIAFGYGYTLKESTGTVDHFDIETPDKLYYCKKNKIGWDVEEKPNPTGKINVIYYRQQKEWSGAEIRINRDEYVDSKAADTNEYFADPKMLITADIVGKLSSPETVGDVLQANGADSRAEYITPPTASEMKTSEKQILKESILMDTFTPDFSYENMKGMGVLSGEALRRALILGYIKRENQKEIYDLLVDREKNLILTIMAKITHIRLKSQIEKMKIKHSFSEPFDDDVSSKWAAIGRAYSDGIVSLDTAVRMMSIANPNEEIEKIKAEKAEQNEDNMFPRAGLD
ncbi:hypothetical protein AGMMS49525_04800 [Bacteroidia bacterium]|nr:hypothetical protein AGMMS49525_04800 [Bacteroidia bacterium]